jgi:hypothetical protein
MIPIWGTKGPFIRPRCIGAVRSRTLIKSINQSIPDDDQLMIETCWSDFKCFNM